MIAKTNISNFETVFGGIKGPSFNVVFNPRNWMEDYACSLVDGRDFTKRMDEETKLKYAKFQEGL